MRQRLVAALAASLVGAHPAVSETVFAVTTDDILTWSNLGETAEQLASLKLRGISKDEMLRAMAAGGTPDDIASAVSNVLYSFDSQDPSVYRSVMGALCLQDKLVPVEVNR